MAQPLIPSADAPLVVKPRGGFFSMPTFQGRFEWDGTSLIYKVGLTRREVARAGEGELLRLRYAGPQLHSYGPRLVWIGADGRERGDFSELQWPVEELLHIAALARIPVTELGTITHRELYERYPDALPKLFGMDPATPVSWGVLRQAVRDEASATRTLTARDRLMLGVALLTGAAALIAAAARNLA